MEGELDSWKGSLAAPDRTSEGHCGVALRFAFVPLTSSSSASRLWLQEEMRKEVIRWLLTSKTLHMILQRQHLTLIMQQYKIHNTRNIIVIISCLPEMFQRLRWYSEIHSKLHQPKSYIFNLTSPLKKSFAKFLFFYANLSNTIQKL